MSLSPSCNLRYHCNFLFFSCFLLLWPLPSPRYCFHCLGCRVVLHFSPPFLILAAIFICQAIFIAGIHFVAVQPESNYHGFYFKGGPSFCWISIFALVLFHFAAKDAFVVTTGHRPFFCFSRCHCYRHFHTIIFSSLFLMSLFNR